jgi:DNA-binding response OmpR family regulator
MENIHKDIHVFIVEDDLYMQNLLSFHLSAQYNISSFDNGLEALASLQMGNVPDVILSDLNTPEIGGLELIKQIKASGFFSFIPILILSGEENSDTRIQCLNAGADDFIVKPFNPQELDARLKIVLKRLGKVI